MKLKNNERKIKHYSIDLLMSSKIAKPTHSMDDFCQGLESVVGTNKAIKLLKEGSDEIAIELVSFAQSAAKISPEIVRNEHTETLTDGYIDIGSNDIAIGYVTTTNLSDAAQVKRDRNTKSITSNDLEIDQEYIYGCHFFIEKNKDENQFDYKIFIETVPNLGVSRIQRLLRHCIEEIHKDKKATEGTGFLQGEHIDGKKSKGKPLLVSYRLMPEIKGIPAGDIETFVNQGFAKSIYMERRKSQKTSLGAINYLNSKKEEWLLKFDKKNLSGGAWNTIKDFFYNNRKDYASARILYSTPDGDDGEATIDTETGNVLADKLIKGTVVSDITPLLRNSDGGIVPHFCRLALKELEL